MAKSFLKNLGVNVGWSRSWIGFKHRLCCDIKVKQNPFETFRVSIEEGHTAIISAMLVTKSNFSWPMFSEYSSQDSGQPHDLYIWSELPAKWIVTTHQHAWIFIPALTHKYLQVIDQVQWVWPTAHKKTHYVNLCKETKIVIFMGFIILYLPKFSSVKSKLTLSSTHFSPSQI